MFELQVNGATQLRLLEPRHASALFALVEANRQHLRQWLPWLDANVCVADTLQFIGTTQRQWADNTGFVAGIWQGGELAGVIGHNRIDGDNRIGYLGYWLGAAFEGQGVMTNCCCALIGHAFEELKLNRIEIRCAVGNRKSRAIPERLGFRQEGVIRQPEWLYDKYVDHVVYGVLADEWSS